MSGLINALEGAAVNAAAGAAGAAGGGRENAAAAAAPVVQAAPAAAAPSPVVVESAAAAAADPALTEQVSAVFPDAPHDTQILTAMCYTRHNKLPLSRDWARLKRLPHAIRRRLLPNKREISPDSIGPSNMLRLP